MKILCWILENIIQIFGYIKRSVAKSSNYWTRNPLSDRCVGRIFDSCLPCFKCKGYIFVYWHFCMWEVLILAPDLKAILIIKYVQLFSNNFLTVYRSTPWWHKQMIQLRWPTIFVHVLCCSVVLCRCLVTHNTLIYLIWVQKTENYWIYRSTKPWMLEVLKISNSDLGDFWI